MTKKAMLTVLAATVLGAGTLAGTAQAKVTLKYGTIYPTTAEVHQAVVIAGQLMEQRSGGEIEMKIFPSEQLGKLLDQIENVKNGTQDFAMTWGGLSRFCPTFKLFNFPFLYRDAQHVYDVMFGELGQKEIQEYLIANHGLRMVGGIYAGARNLTTSEKFPVKVPSDMNGVRLRTPDDPTWIKSWAHATGAKVSTFPWGELYMALKQGIVDAQENPLPSIRAMKFYEVQKNIMLTEHVYNTEIVLMNDKKFKKLDKKLQDIVLSSLHDAYIWSRAKIDIETDKNAKFFAEQGLNMVKVDRTVWQKAFADAPSLFEGGKEMYEKIQAVK